ncbi:MAG: YafY family transcriptional regulator [Flavipsychrobacter sp.]|nr:YafY family transcriptional regulator [Flavipsychrobacter sp.]
MNRIDRLFGILTFLQSRKYVTAEAIAEKFGMSVRTVYRDIKALNEQGVPVSFEQHKGYFVVQGYFLPPVSFSTEEANALLLMERIVEGFADRSIQTHYTSALQKVKAVMRPSDKEKLETLTQKMHFQMPECFTPDFEYLSPLQNAIVARHVVLLDYKNNKSEVSQRKVEPIGLAFYAFAWHLIAWCQLRQDYRDFKVSRILKARNLELPFTNPNPMELKDYMKSIPVDY